MRYDVVVIGGGPAGMAAALEALKTTDSVALIERDFELGGILNQCIHSGFGLEYFSEELTGPEYANRFIKQIYDSKCDIYLSTMVLELTKDKKITALSPQKGLFTLEANAVVLAMGCRERTRGGIKLPGERPSGILTAGTAQKYINCTGFMIGKRAVILGSGDIGLIMARRLTLEGAEVVCVAELSDTPGGLRRNVSQCLDDYNIPLYLSHTVTDIKGENGRLSQVTLSKVDENKQPIESSEMVIDCDTLLLSVGLIPENELSELCGVMLHKATNGAVVFENGETTVPGIFSCGNVLHVHDIVDYVTEEASKTGAAAANYRQSNTASPYFNTDHCKQISYLLPHRVHTDISDKFVNFYLRTRKIEENIKIVFYRGDTEIAAYKREFTVPSEMEHIKLPTALLKKADGDMFVKIEEV